MAEAYGGVHIPKLVSVRRAVEIYYENYELGNREITELFGCGVTTAQNLKRLAKAKMAEEGIMQRVSHCVSTDAAYRAWGLDIDSLERRVRRADKVIK